MKKTHKNKSGKKGFTLVELIVVLVILAVLAAMLVPALAGYIKKAKREKDMEMAATYRAAAQAVLTEMYGRDEWVSWDRGSNPSTSRTATSYAWKTAYGNRIMDLVGDPSGHPYLLYIQCGRYNWYANPDSPDHTRATEAYAYTCYRIYYQATKDSSLIIIDDNGVCDAESYAQRAKDYKTRDYIIDGSGNKIYTVVYAIEHGPNSNPAANLQNIERGSYKT